MVTVAAMGSQADENLPSPLEELLHECAIDREVGNLEKAIEGYRTIISAPLSKSYGTKTSSSKKDTQAVTIEERNLRVKESAISLLASALIAVKRPQELKQLLISVQETCDYLPKVRSARIVRTIIDIAGTADDSGCLQTELCEEAIQWCLKEKRTFLRHRIELRFATLLLAQKRFTLCHSVLTSLLVEVKKLDDKLLLVDIHLLDCMLQLALRHIPKAKAALTASRTNANAIHCPPLLQAEIDMQSGTLHTEEKDFVTAYTYYYEAFEAFQLANDPRAKNALVYMCIVKLMAGRPSEVLALATGPKAFPYYGRSIEAIVAVAKSHTERSLKMLESTLHKYRDALGDDPLVQGQIQAMYERLLEQNITQILLPFSRVEITHVAKLLDMSTNDVLLKLGEMVLDKKLMGTLDQGAGILILFDHSDISPFYDNILGSIANLNEVVAALQRKVPLAA